MKIVWRNPNSIHRTWFSIVKTLAVEHPGELRVFYRSSRGPGALATFFELMVNRDAVSRAAKSTHWAPGRFRSQFLLALARRKGSRRIATKMQKQNVVREDMCFAAWKSP